jgi:hypothetical protein
MKHEGSEGREDNEEELAAQPHASRSIGAVYSDATAANYFMPLRARESFDLLLFVETTTSARKNPGR